MTVPDPTADARLVAAELARMVGRVSARGDLPESFADQLLAPEADGALAILIDTADTGQRASGGGLGPELLARLADGLITSPDRVSRSRAVVPLVESLRHHPEVAAELLAREEAVDALVAGPRRPRLERALVRVLLAVAPLRSPAAVATVVRRLGRADVDLDRLANGVTALLVECFDDLAGLSLGVEEWTELSIADLNRLVATPALPSRRDEPPLHPVRHPWTWADAGRPDQRPGHPRRKPRAGRSGLRRPGTAGARGAPGLSRGRIEADAGHRAAAAARTATG